MRKLDHSAFGEAVVDIEEIKKYFKVGNNTVRALRGVSFKVFSKDFIVIFGPSGCGKSTLLNLILGIERPTHGTISIRGKNIFHMSEDHRANFRLSKVGMVHQFPYWIRSLTVRENVAMPLIIKGLSEKESLARADHIMEELGLGELEHQLPTQLSGGQQQRSGLARALVTNPSIIIADEPTGNLDSVKAEEIMRLLHDLNAIHKRTVILVTHNDKYWNYGNRRIEMEDGKIIKDYRHKDGSKIPD
jgi:putative ABC transport system ATP-binding protein